MSNANHPEVPTSPHDMLARTHRRAMELRRRRRWAFGAATAAVVAAAVAVPLVVAGDGRGAKVVQVIGAPTTVPVPTTTATSPSTGGPGTTPTSATTTGNPGRSTPASTSTTAGPPGRHGPSGCTSGQLHAGLTAPNGAAGSVGYELQLVNTGGVTCTLGGYPGVSYVSAAGTTVGAPAARTVPGTPRTITLAPGQAAAAILIAVDSYNYPPVTCRLTTVAGLRVYPPNQTVALLVPHPGQACANPANPVLRVGPLLPGAAQG